MTDSPHGFMGATPLPASTEETRFPTTRMMGGAAPSDSLLNREIFAHASKVGGVKVALAVYAATADVWYSGGDAAYAAIVEREGVTEENAEAFHQYWLRAFCDRLAQYEAEDRAALPSSVPAEITEAVRKLTFFANAENRVEAIQLGSRLESIYREQQEEIEGLVRVKDGYFEELVRVRAALSSLKDEQLTPEEAEKILTLIEGNVPLFEAELPVMEKLRALSTKPEINK